MPTRSHWVSAASELHLGHLVFDFELFFSDFVARQPGLPDPVHNSGDEDPDACDIDDLFCVSRGGRREE